jgi:hypothetical protein
MKDSTMEFGELFALFFWQSIVSAVECAIIGWPWWCGPVSALLLFIPLIGLIVSNAVPIWAIVVAFQHWGFLGGLFTLCGLGMFHQAIIRSTIQRH